MSHRIILPAVKKNVTQAPSSSEKKHDVHVIEFNVKQFLIDKGPEKLKDDFSRFSDAVNKITVSLDTNGKVIIATSMPQTYFSTTLEILSDPLPKKESIKSTPGKIEFSLDTLNIILTVTTTTPQPKPVPKQTEVPKPKQEFKKSAKTILWVKDNGQLKNIEIEFKLSRLEQLVNKLDAMPKPNKKVDELVMIMMKEGRALQDSYEIVLAKLNEFAKHDDAFKQCLEIFDNRIQKSNPSKQIRIM